MLIGVIHICHIVFFEFVVLVFFCLGLESSLNCMADVIYVYHFVYSQKLCTVKTFDIYSEHKNVVVTIISALCDVVVAEWYAS